MNFLIRCWVALFLTTLAVGTSYGQQSGSTIKGGQLGSVSVIENKVQDGNLALRVNDGGVATSVAEVVGANSNMAIRHDSAVTTMPASVVDYTFDTLLLKNNNDTVGNFASLGFSGRSSNEMLARIAAKSEVNNGRGNLYFQTGNTDGSGLQTVGIAESSGAWTLGSSTATSGAAAYVNTASGGILFLRNFEATTASDNDAGLYVVKGSSTGTTSQVFVVFRVAGSTNNGSITANGANQATFTAFSDRRLKENIGLLPPQLSKIMKLKPSEFDYRDGSGHQTGFIAQEFQDVYPDAVSEDPETKMLTLAGWGKTEARLVKAVQEQQAIIESLKARLDAAGL